MSFFLFFVLACVILHQNTCRLPSYPLKSFALIHPSGVRFKIDISLYRHDDTGLVGVRYVRSNPKRW